MELKKTGPFLPLEWAPPQQPLIANIGKPLLYMPHKERKEQERGKRSQPLLQCWPTWAYNFVGQKASIETLTF